MIHWISLLEASRSLISDGIATFRIVLSMTMTSSERHSTPSVHHRLSCTSSSLLSPSTAGLLRLFDTEPSSIVMLLTPVAACDVVAPNLAAVTLPAGRDARLRLTEWTSCGGCAAKWGASVLAEIVGELPSASTRRCSSAWRRSTTRRSTASTTRRRSCRPPTSSRRSSTTRPTTGRSPRPTPAATCSPWAAVSCWRSTSPPSPSTSRGGRWRPSSTPPLRSSPRPAARSPAGTRSATPSRCSASRCRGWCIPTRCSARAARGPATPCVLSKPLGTGLVLAGGSDDDKAAATEGMRRLNRGAAEALRAAGPAVHAVTDVTGYGLAGHGWEVAERSGVRLVVDTAGLVAYPGAVEAAERGVRTGGDARNREYVAGHVDTHRVGVGGGVGVRPADLRRPAGRRRPRRRPTLPGFSRSAPSNPARRR